MNSEQDTLPNLQTVLDAIKNLRQEMNARFNEHDKESEQMRRERVNLDIQLDRLQAMAYENLRIIYSRRADAKILRLQSKRISDLRSRVA